MKKELYYYVLCGDKRILKKLEKDGYAIDKEHLLILDHYDLLGKLIKDYIDKYW